MIVIIYQKEPHVGTMAFRNIRQPESFDERVALAKRMKEEYEMPMDVLVDTMDDASRKLFSDLPSPVFVIDKEGYVRDKFPWPDQEQIADSIKRIRAEPSIEALAIRQLGKYPIASEQLNPIF